MDISCKLCGDQWDTYGLRSGQGDMRPNEGRRFLNGEGCPSCGFGTKCPDCSGTGVEEWLRYPGQHYSCPECRDSRTLAVREPLWLSNVLNYGYLPDVRTLKPKGFEADVRSWIRTKATMLDLPETLECLEGEYVSYFILCPFCMTEPGTPKDWIDLARCQRCEGDGKFRHRSAEQKEELELQFLQSVFENDDL